MKPEHGKLEAVQDFSTSETKSQVRAFLGLTGYYQRFIPDYSSIAAPLIDLTRKLLRSTSYRGYCVVLLY